LNTSRLRNNDTLISKSVSFTPNKIFKKQTQDESNEIKSMIKY